MPTETNMRVALVHDWLNGYRGGERVLEAIAELYPQADVFTLFHAPGKAGPRIEKHRIQASLLNRLPGVQRYYRYLLPLFPMAIESFDLTGYDLVISSSHCVAKGVLVAPGTLHVCYIHTPVRYAWDRAEDYFSKGGQRVLTAPFLHYLRLWDVASSSRVDHFIANSSWVKRRVEKYYRRDADVVHPFADLSAFRPAPGPGDYYLVVSALVPYKRVDLAIRAANGLAVPLVVVGTGPEADKLKAIAGRTVRFTGAVSQTELARWYAGAKALIFPGEEDFGIVPLEAMASGRPVIALGRGGVLDTVIDGKTGLFFSESTIESLCAAIDRFERSAARGITAEACRRRAEEFTKTAFQDRFRRLVQHWLRPASSGTPRASDERPLSN